MDDYGLAEVREIIQHSKTRDGRDKAQAWQEHIDSKRRKAHITAPMRKAASYTRLKAQNWEGQGASKIIRDAQIRAIRILFIIVAVLGLLKTCS